MASGGRAIVYNGDDSFGLPHVYTLDLGTLTSTQLSRATRSVPMFVSGAATWWAEDSRANVIRVPVGLAIREVPCAHRWIADLRYDPPAAGRRHRQRFVRHDVRECKGASREPPQQLA